MSFFIRLDDAAAQRDVDKWDKMETLFDRYSIKPLVGVIPFCKDPEMQQYAKDENFWDRVKQWQKKGWIIGLHGCYHLYTSNSGGLNPVHNRSEFAGETLKKQRNLIKTGIAELELHGIDAKVFSAPSHTFDRDTITALKRESKIRIISDTIAIKPYKKYGITFVPQQISQVKRIPFFQITFCYHPNMMREEDFRQLEEFLKKNKNRFRQYPIELVNRKESIWDIGLQRIYFWMRSRKTR